MLLDRDQFGNSGLQNADIPASVSVPRWSSKRSPTSVPAPDIPIQEAAQCAGDKCDSKVRRKAEHQNTQSCAGKASQENRLPSNLVTQPPPHDTRGEFSQGEGRRDHSGVHGNFAFIFCDVKVLDHVVDIREDRHEGDWLAYPAEGCVVIGGWLEHVMAYHRQ